MMMFRTALLASAALAAAPAFANDSTAELGTGGLILSRNDVIAMQSEDLFISRDRVKVDYVFRNGSDTDITTIVAFPMPEIVGGPDMNISIPDDTSDNFLGFSGTSDGQPIQPQLEQKAFAVGLDITAELTAHGVSLNPFAQEVYDQLAKLPEDVANEWRDRGLITLNEYDDGSGWKKERTPLWELRSTYWWRATFPAGKDVHVSHSYKPSVGSTAGLSFFYDGQFQGDYDDYKGRYCIDSGFENAVRKAAKTNGDSFPPYSESRIDYVLTTGGNWALGTIGKFRLTIDKGDPKSIVSFCGTGVKKIGPTTFQMEAEDFYPEQDIQILFLDTWSDEGGPQ
jgi:hypothetical protein